MPGINESSRMEELVPSCGADAWPWVSNYNYRCGHRRCKLSQGAAPLVAGSDSFFQLGRQRILGAGILCDCCTRGRCSPGVAALVLWKESLLEAATEIARAL